MFLSPLGYELNSRDEALAHLEFEATVNETLLETRAGEYRQYRENVKGVKKGGQGQKQQGRHKKAVNSPERRMSGRQGAGAGQNGEATASSSSSSSSASSSSSSSSSVTIASPPVAGDEEGLLPTGKLCSFETPPSHSIQWRATLAADERNSVLLPHSFSSSPDAASVIGIIFE